MCIFRVYFKSSNQKDPTSFTLLASVLCIVYKTTCTHLLVFSHKSCFPFRISPSQPSALSRIQKNRLPKNQYAPLVGDSWNNKTVSYKRSISIHLLYHFIFYLYLLPAMPCKSEFTSRSTLQCRNSLFLQLVKSKIGDSQNISSLIFIYRGVTNAIIFPAICFSI